jgi:hypothetical protein
MDEGSCQVAILELTLISKIRSIPVKLKVVLSFIPSPGRIGFPYVPYICKKETDPLRYLLLSQHRTNEIPKSMNTNTVVRLVSSFTELQRC